MSFLKKLWHKVLHPTTPWGVTGNSIAIIGSGSWATAVARMVVERTGHIGWYIRRPEQIAEFRRLHHNPSYLTSLQFDTGEISFYSDINQLAKKYDTLVFVVPSPYLKGYLDNITVDLSRKTVVSAIKGMVAGEDMLVSDYMRVRFGIKPERIMCIGGPTHAEEVAMHHLTMLTIGCAHLNTARKFAAMMRSDYVRAEASADITGIEYAAILKNIYAICAGICNGLRYGDNFLAVLLSNSVKEMERFLNTAAPGKRNICDSAYLGDLAVTCYSNFSRNRTFGTMIGRGYSVKSAQMEMKMVAEGYYGTKCIAEINYVRYHVDTPIINTVYSILYQNARPEQAIRELTLCLT